jgi:hypothetical protein
MTNKSTRMLRVKDIYGRNGKIPIGHTKFHADYVERAGASKNIPGTSVPRLRLYPLGPRAVAAFESDVDALLEGIRAEGGKKRRAS